MWSRMKPWCTLKPGFCSERQIKTMIGRLLLLCVIIAGCVNTEYRFERVDGEQPVALGLKFDSMYGVRDGESVRAEARFTGGHDSAKVNIALNLGPPVQFTSGTYVAIIGDAVPREQWPASRSHSWAVKPVCPALEEFLY